MAIGIVQCSVCGSSFSGSSNAEYCSNKCKQSKYRTLKLTKGFIYKLKRDGVVVYVGQSISEKGVKGRVSSHLYGEHPKVFDDHEFYRVDGANLSEVECAEIMKYKPIYNRILPINTTYLTVKNFSKSLHGLVENIVNDCCEVHSLCGDKEEYGRYIKKDDLDSFKIQLSMAVRGMRKNNKHKSRLDEKESSDD